MMSSRPMHSPHASARRFPNTGTSAYFEPNSQTIWFTTIQAGDIEIMRSSQDHRGLATALGTAYHEVTHWADLVGTVWGRSHLRRTYDCLRLLDEVETTGREHEFYRFIDQYDEERRLMLPRYYTTIDEDGAPHNHLRRWGIQFSAGREFDSMGRVDENRPILFVKFLDQSTGRQIVRQPLTVGALLETNAVWSELQTRREILAGIPAAERVAEETYWSDHLLAELYHPDLTLYTAPVHFLSHHAGIVDASTAYMLSARVAHLALNLCPPRFDTLRPPAAFEAWSNLIPGFRRSRNHAFAYAAICVNGGPLPPGGDVADWIEQALAASSLPASAELLAEAREEATSQLRGAEASPVDEAERHLLQVGLHMFDHRARDVALTPGRAAADRLALPAAFDEDGRLFNLSPTTLDPSVFDPVAAEERRHELQEWTANFLSSCR